MLKVGKKMKTREKKTYGFNSCKEEELKWEFSGKNGKAGKFSSVPTINLCGLQVLCCITMDAVVCE